MKNSKLRRQIAWQAAKLMYDREESEYYRAKMKAARRIYKGWVHAKDLPSNAEIRDEIQLLAVQLEGEDRTDRLMQMRFAAMSMMQLLEKYRPRIIGSVLTGHVRQGSDIDIHVFSNSVQAVANELWRENFRAEISSKRVRKQGVETTYHHIHVHDQFPFELTIYPVSMLSHVFKSSITGKPIERASIKQFEQLLADFYPEKDITEEIGQVENSVDRFQYYESLLLPLENVKQNPAYHPEGDALYHSLQVFDLAADRLPYDEEFLLAALLHDVGKGIDPGDHVFAGLEALGDFVTERTAWLVENHMLAHKINDQTIGSRKHKRLRENDSYEELVILGECDRAGRKIGIATSTLDHALDYVRDLSDSFG